MALYACESLCNACVVLCAKLVSFHPASLPLSTKEGFSLCDKDSFPGNANALKIGFHTLLASCTADTHPGPSVYPAI